MTLRETLLAEIDAFLGRAGIAETTFGRKAVNDGKFVGSLRQGRDVNSATIDRVRAFIARHPVDSPAPPDVERMTGNDDAASAEPPRVHAARLIA